MKPASIKLLMTDTPLASRLMTASPMLLESVSKAKVTINQSKPTIRLPVIKRFCQLIA
jgi:hypothetical protein